MECPLCGELCTCADNRGSSSARGREEIPSHVAVLIDPESLEANDSQDAPQSLNATQSSEPALEASLPQTSEPAPETAAVEVPLDEVAEVLASVAVAAPLVEAEAARASATASQLSSAASAPPVAGAPPPFYRPDDSAWRQEVSSRVDSFRSRRRGRFDPNSSLSLDFDPAYEAEAPAPALPAEAPKVIEFPRPAATPVVEELAEPVVEKPRILEAEEPLEEVAAPVAAPPVASITLEPAAEETAVCGQREILLWLAPPAQRIFAGLVDALVVATAAGLFGLIFLRMTGAVLSGRMAAGFALALPAFFWAFYQYIFLVYGGTTPGLQMSGLHLTTFDGNPVPRRQRRWRALATMVSCASLGLGFLWALVDEDGLGWHDRITRTCVRE